MPRTLIVTAVARGIGHAMSRGFAGQGAAVVMADPQGPVAAGIAAAIGRDMPPDDLVGSARFLRGASAGFIPGQPPAADGGAFPH